MILFLKTVEESSEIASASFSFGSKKSFKDAILRSKTEKNLSLSKISEEVADCEEKNVQGVEQPCPVTIVCDDTKLQSEHSRDQEGENETSDRIDIDDDKSEITSDMKGVNDEVDADRRSLSVMKTHDDEITVLRFVPEFIKANKIAYVCL